MTQASQRYDPLPDQWWEYRYKASTAFPVTYLPPPPLINPQHGQQLSYTLPDYWQAFPTKKAQPLPLTYLPPPPLINPQHGQQLSYVLPDYWSEYPVYIEVPYAQWYIPTKPPSRQGSQRIDPLPDHWSEYSAYTETPFIQWFVPPLPRSFQGIQRVDQLPDYWTEYQAYAQRPYSQWYIPATPLPHQGSQRIDPLPDYWSEYSAFAEAPYAQWYIPATPLPRQGSQRVDQPFDVWQGWTTYKAPPALPITYLSLPPLINPQQSQRVDQPPDYWAEYQTQRQASYAQWFIPPLPPTRQSSQRVDPLPEWWQAWTAYDQYSYAQWYTPDRPPSHQSNQRVDPLSELSYSWWVGGQHVQAVSLVIQPILPSLSQRIDQPSNPNDHWYRLHTTWPIPMQFVLLQSLTKQPSQSLYFDPSPLSYQWWNRSVFAPDPGLYSPASQRIDQLPEYSDIWYRPRVVCSILAVMQSVPSFIISWVGKTNLAVSSMGTTNLVVSCVGTSPAIPLSPRLLLVQPWVNQQWHHWVSLYIRSELMPRQDAIYWQQRPTILLPADPISLLPNQVVRYQAVSHKAAGEGGNVTQLLDSSGNNNNSTGYNDGAVGTPPTYTASGPNGQPALVCNDRGFICPSVFPTNSSCAGAVVMKIPTAQNGRSHTGFGSSDALRHNIIFYSDGSTVGAFTSFFPTSIKPGILNPDSGLTYNEVEILAWNFDTALGYQNCYRDGKWIYNAVSVAPLGGRTGLSAETDATLRWLAAGTGAGNGIIGQYCDGILFNNNPTPRSWNTLWNTWANTYGLTKGNPLVLCDGASGVGTANIVSQLSALLTGTNDVTDIHASGNTIANRQVEFRLSGGNAPSYNARNYNSTGIRPSNIVFLFCNNDIDVSGGMTATAFLVILQNYYATVRGCGFYFVWTPHTSRIPVNVTQSAYDTVRATALATVLANPGVYCDAVVPATDTRIFGAGGADVNYFPGGIDMNPAGGAILSALAAPLIQPLLAG